MNMKEVPAATPEEFKRFEANHATKRHITLRFRWPVAVVSKDSHSVELEIPTVDIGGVAPLSLSFINALKLSDAEIERAEYALMRAVALIPEG